MLIHLSTLGAFYRLLLSRHQRRGGALPVWEYINLPVEPKKVSEVTPPPERPSSWVREQKISRQECALTIALENVESSGSQERPRCNLSVPVFETIYVRRVSFAQTRNSERTV